MIRARSSLASSAGLISAPSLAHAHTQQTHNTTQLNKHEYRFEDDSENLIDNATNLTYGTWVWCRNESSFGSLHWRNGSIPGAPVMKPHQKFFTIAKCVSVDGPGLLDDEGESEEEEKAKDMEQVCRNMMHTHTLTHTLTHSHSHTHTHTHTHSHAHTMAGGT